MLKASAMDFVTLLLIAVVGFWSLVTSMPIGGDQTTTTTAPALSDSELKEYLQQYMYMAGDTDDPDSPLGQLQAHDIESAIRAFQRRWNLTETGVADGETLRLMLLDRCGVPDVMTPEDLGRKRKKRYELQGSEWPNNELTYTITAYPADDLTGSSTDGVIARALNVWAEVTPLEFERQDNGQADIQVMFARRSHGDGQPFDGTGRILAHAYFPQFGGDAHFDDEEPWTVGSSSGINLFQVAAHEFGHSLGLGHSNDRDALMAPFYDGYTPDFHLSDDDISGIQRLYGSNTDPVRTDPPPVPSPQPTPAPPPGAPNFCANSRFDAVTLHEVNRRALTYVFQGDYYALITDSGMAPDYPRRISDDWPGLPGNLDAALYWETEYEYSRQGGQVQVAGVKREGRTYFFKGSQYWRYENMQLKATYPRQISTNWNGLPDNVDAAFVWSGNRRTYFFKGDQYYRYTSMRGVDSGYPRDVSIWSGVPWPLDAAVQWRNAKTYFFSGTEYYRFDDANFAVDSNNYPRSNGYWWLGCTGNNLQHEDDNQREESTPEAGGHSSGAGVVSLNIYVTLISALVFVIR